MLNKQTGDNICLEKTSDLAYTAPTLTILGSAEELTKGNETGSIMDCSRPGTAGIDEACS